MRRLRIYVDTSVFGGVQDDEFADTSRRFFGAVSRGKFTVVISRQVTAELESAPEEVKRVLAEIPATYLEEVPVDSEVVELADAYVSSGVLSETSREDAIHVAAATVADADLILSWNFKHIVRYDRVRKFNGVNAIMGYQELDIRSPLEVEHDE
jgi:predicted nucleic acid-binding protein